MNQDEKGGVASVEAAVFWGLTQINKVVLIFQVLVCCVPHEILPGDLSNKLVGFVTVLLVFWNRSTDLDNLSSGFHSLAWMPSSQTCIYGCRCSL